MPFSHTKSFPFTERLRTALKSLSFPQPKHRLFEQLFTVLKNRLFMCKKPFICTSLSLLVSKTAHFHKPKAVLSHKPFLLPPKATLFHPSLSISTTLNLLFAKNTAVLLLFALTPFAVKPEPRTDSNHCRRYPAKLQLFAKPVT